MLHLCRKHLPSRVALSLLQFPTPDADPVLLTLVFFCPPSFVLLSVAWFYIFFSNGQVLSWHLQDLLCLPKESSDAFSSLALMSLFYSIIIKPEVE